MKTKGKRYENKNYRETTIDFKGAELFGAELETG